ncbi:MAG: HepT-like ribonuclease domain-containing protein [Dehalococcoidia bacterium]
MTRRQPDPRLTHMRAHAREAIEFTRGRVRADLDTDRMLTLALVRLLESVGEAAARAALETRDQYPGIPWPQIVGLRNRLIHEYHEIDLDIVWTVTTRDLPALLSELERADTQGPA